MNTLPNNSRVSFENPKAWPHSGNFSRNNTLETDSTVVRPWASFTSRYRWQNSGVYFYHWSFYKFCKFLPEFTSHRQQSTGEPAYYSTVCDSQEPLTWGSAYVEWRRQWHPTPVLLPGKSHGRRSLVGCSPWGHEESDTTERLHFHFSLSCTGEGNGNPLQCSCLENPRDGGTSWAVVSGVAQSRTRLKRLSSSSSRGFIVKKGLTCRKASIILFD